MKEENSVEHYSIIEADELLSELLKQDSFILKITKVLDILGCKYRTGMESIDVIQAVFLAILEGRRKWPKLVTPTKYLIETCKSEVSNIEKKRKIEILSTYDQENNIQNLTDDFFEDTLNTVPDTSQIKHDNRLLIESWLTKIMMLFENDKSANCIIKQLLNEKKKSIIMSLCKLTENIYLNARKRIKDKVSKKFPNGIHWWEDLS